MGVKTAGVGHFAIPTAPAAGTSVTSGAANTFTTTPVQLIASTAAALYITGVHLEAAAAKAATYVIVQLMIGASGSETIVGQYLVPLSTASTVALGYRQIYPFIPVANGVRISAKTADSVGAAATLVTLECIAQSNVVDDAIPVSRVTLVDTLTTYTGNTVQTGDSFARLGAAGAGLTAIGDTRLANLDAAVSTRTKPADTQAAVTTVTNLTNAPTAGDLTATMKASVTTAATAATPTAAAVSGAVGSVTGAVGSVTAAVTLPTIPAGWISAAGIAAGALNAKGDWLLASGYAAPPTVSAIRIELDTNSTKLANLDAAVSTRSTLAAGAAMTLTAAYDASKTAATQASVSAIPTTPLLAASYVVPPTAAAIRAEIDANSAGLAAIYVRTDVATSTRLASASYTAPDNAAISAIKGQTDQLAFSAAGQVDANTRSVNSTPVLGTGTVADPWRSA